MKADRRGLILSMIHKFEGIEKDASTHDNIFVFIDEAHRSMAGDLGTYLMAARRAEELARGFPAAVTNAEEHRRLRASLYGPVIKLESGDRLRVVSRIMELLLPPVRDDRS
ncbi:MAG: hypothetical protein OXC11_00630 [Rhodospirillales bacterium]|nr:hypothetical protein [Rhodospirillales bacterium]